MPPKSKRRKCDSDQGQGELIPETEINKNQKCRFCGQGITGYGNLDAGGFYFMSGQYYHYHCILFSAGSKQENNEKGIHGFTVGEVTKILGKSHKCTFCTKPGATIKCERKNCKKVYHFPCGMNKMAAFIIDGQKIQSLCQQHAPKQKRGKDSNYEDKTMCVYCSDDFEGELGPKPGRIACNQCHNVYHHNCIQKSAIFSKSEAFQCPFCKNKDEFIKEVIRFGIFVPSGDAALEDDPFYQWDQQTRRECIAKKCLCRMERGRAHHINGTKFELVSCDECGDNNIHIECGRLNRKNLDYICTICVARMKRESEEREEGESSSQEDDIDDLIHSSEDGEGEGYESDVSLDNDLVAACLARQRNASRTNTPATSNQSFPLSNYLSSTNQNSSSIAAPAPSTNQSTSRNVQTANEEIPRKSANRSSRKSANYSDSDDICEVINEPSLPSKKPAMGKRSRKKNSIPVMREEDLRREREEVEHLIPIIPAHQSQSSKSSTTTSRRSKCQNDPESPSTPAGSSKLQFSNLDHLTDQKTLLLTPPSGNYRRAVTTKQEPSPLANSMLPKPSSQDSRVPDQRSNNTPPLPGSVDSTRRSAETNKYNNVFSVVDQNQPGPSNVKVPAYDFLADQKNLLQPVYIDRRTTNQSTSNTLSDISLEKEGAPMTRNAHPLFGSAAKRTGTASLQKDYTLSRVSPPAPQQDQSFGSHGPIILSAQSVGLNTKPSEPPEEIIISSDEESESEEEEVEMNLEICKIQGGVDLDETPRLNEDSDSDIEIVEDVLPTPKPHPAMSAFI